MSNRDSRPMRSRIVVEAPARQYQRRANARPRYTELWIAISIIIAAVLATFLALFITSRPYDPMNASVAPEQVVPVGPSFTPSPKPSPSASPTPQTLVENSKVTVVGSVRSIELKQRVERLIRSLKGVSSVDNQLVITQATPSLSDKLQFIVK